MSADRSCGEFGAAVDHGRSTESGSLNTAAILFAELAPVDDDAIAALREAVATLEPLLLKSTGSGLMASFSSVRPAVAAAAVVLAAPAGHRARIGLNVGDVAWDAGDLYGLAVNVAKRLCERAAPGQVLAGRLVAELTGDMIASDIGELQLRGVDSPVAACELAVGTSSTRAKPGAELATVLVTDMVGSTSRLSRLGDDVADGARRAHFRQLRWAITAFGGQERRSTGDGIVATFPSAVSAVRCAVGMQRGVDRHRQGPGGEPLAIRVGLEIGELAGDVASAPVDTAQRICDAADSGAIVVSERLGSLLGSRGGFNLEPAGSNGRQTVKWKVEASPLPLPDVAVVTRTIVGRREELARLERRWEQARLGRCGLVAVGGEPGIGKTRVALELGRRIHTAGGAVLYGRCQQEALAAYHPWREALRHYVRHAPLEDLAAAGSQVGELSSLLPELGERLSGLVSPLGPNVEGDHFRVFEAVVDLLVGGARMQPVLIVLDDLQWADAGSLALLVHLLQSAEDAPFLVIGTYRGSELARGHLLGARLNELERESLAERLVLTGLSEAEAADLIEADAGPAVVPVLARAVHLHTEGNPLWIKELLRAQGHPEQLDPDRLGVPESAKALIARRLERLSEASRSLLAAAAVAGRDSTLELLQTVTGLSEDEALRAVEESVAAHVLIETPGAPDGYSFAHALFREALYDSLVTARRLRLHQRIGAVLERYGEQRLADVAYHYGIAATAVGPEKVVGYAIAAGQRAVNLRFHEEAAAHFERALAALDLSDEEDGVRRCQLLLSLGDARWRSGALSAAKASFVKAGDVARTLGSAEDLAQAALGYGGPRVTGRVDDQLVALLEEALRALSDEDSALRAQVLGRLAMETYYGGEPERRRLLSRQALEMARRLGDDATLAFALSARHVALWEPGNAQARLKLANELLERARRAGDRTLIQQGLTWHITDYLELGRIHEARAMIAEYAARAEELREPLYLWQARMRQGMLALLESRLDMAEAIAAEFLAMAQRAGGDVNAIHFFGAQSWLIRREQGRLAELETPTRQFVALYPAIPAWRCALARLYAETHRLEDARRELDRAMASDCADFPSDLNWLVAISDLAETCALVGNVPRARQLYELLLPHAGTWVEIGYGIAIAGPVDQALGRLAEVLGRNDQAIAHYQAALTQSEAMGAVADAAHARVGLGHALGRRGRTNDAARAAELIAQACATARERGLAAVLESAGESVGPNAPPPPRPGARVAQRIRVATQRGGQAVLGRLIRGSAEQELERRFGSPGVQRALFTAMTASFDAQQAFGFQGDILYELQYASAEIDAWTVSVYGSRASARRGSTNDPQVTVRVPLPDFARLAAGELNPLGAMLDGRLTVQGNATVATRLAGMFGGPGPDP